MADCLKDYGPGTGRLGCEIVSEFKGLMGGAENIAGIWGIIYFRLRNSNELPGGATMFL